MEKILSFNDYEGTYKNSNELVLEGINLDIFAGKMVAIIGQSGAGKSTLFAAILNQLSIKKGDLFIEGKSIQKMSKKDYKNFLQTVGYLTQGDDLVSTDTVFKNVYREVKLSNNFFVNLFNLDWKKKQKHVLEILEKLNIFDKAFSLVSELSGGQKHRVQIARLLTNKKKLILADEPTTGLDIILSQEVIDLLKKVNEENHATVLVTLHDLNLLENNFEDYVAIREGKILKQGKVEEITKEFIEELYKK
ncbi:phosphonate transport system ATP-binding protein [Metamycoplasma subdolum]|uniref:Phosphonate transport system ATP-binding protein n=1 Tax=Metamycoplasma subdolum TaxID=92407 RepID=A0A3M0A353_9BACT|nr:ATP-binding cassette domain-containing protein [Metamycoplasma subdolum]RMA79076.1 phosphonate transport system ATP-binding protein [Metamycoplasma subdolum]WPB50599.1 ATP-binding cassette domain-containing protein [Metamycoplasma subdolum]